MQSFIITAIGSDRPGIVSEMTSLITNNGGNVEESRMSKMGSDFAIIMLIRVLGEYSDSLEVALNSLDDLEISIKETEKHERFNNQYKISLNGADNEGIVNVLSKFFADNSINILEMVTNISSAPMSGTPLFNLSAYVVLPEKMKEKNVRSELETIAQKLSVEISLDL